MSIMISVPASGMILEIYRYYEIFMSSLSIQKTRENNFMKNISGGESIKHNLAEAHMWSCISLFILVPWYLVVCEKY